MLLTDLCRAAAAARVAQTKTGVDGPTQQPALTRLRWQGLTRSDFAQGTKPVNRILAALGLTLLATSSSLAQSRCDQVKEAVATYGYTVAKRYALAHYGKEAVRDAERCLVKAEHRHHIHHL